MISPTNSALSYFIYFDIYQNTGDPPVPYVSFGSAGTSSTHTGNSLAFSNGNVWYAWVDYVGSTTTFNVYLSSTSTKPGSPYLTGTTNLYTTLGSQSQMSLAIQGGTGGSYSIMQIYSFSATVNSVSLFSYTSTSTSIYFIILYYFI
jgi:hypothetical protein